MRRHPAYKRVIRQIENLLKIGRRRIHYTELILKCNISPTYAREILRAFAISNDFSYENGVLIVKDK